MSVVAPGILLDGPDCVSQALLVRLAVRNDLVCKRPLPWYEPGALHLLVRFFPVLGRLLRHCVHELLLGAREHRFAYLDNENTYGQRISKDGADCSYELNSTDEDDADWVV